MKRVQIMLLIAALALAAGALLAYSAPLDRLQGEFTRLLYVHVPTLWIAFLAFGLTALGSVMYLIRKKERWDRLAAGSAELGVLFSVVGVFTGMVWGQAVWGQAWDWSDARLATTAVMIFVYIGYLALRQATADPEKRARRSAILGTIAVVQVPLVYFSVNLWRTLHQTQSIRPDGTTMDPEMLVALLVNVGAFSLAFIALLMGRMLVTRLELAAGADTELAGDTVSPPRLSEIEDV
ncbi:MAG: cytochrome C biogenesis protein [Actinobacteria bacterium]|nr:MAG: cytochrome C biogenesis protein [Actinomycetota bacterium]